MPIRFLYIDDNYEHIVGGQVEALSFDKTALEVIHRPPKGDWEEEMKDLTNNSFFENFDGLILDLRLDDIPINEKKSQYKGTSLAQELRTLSTEGSITEIPIVLLSATDKIKASLDATGKGTFDIKISKEELPSIFKTIQQQLIGLGKGYKALAKSKLIGKSTDWAQDILQLTAENYLEIDERFHSELLSYFEKPFHSLSKFIITSLLESDGLLLKESVLAARLGVSLNSEDWPKLLQALNDAKYNGIFHEGWDRWWAHLVEKEINKRSKESVFLRNLAAAERIELLQRLFGLKSFSEAPKTVFAKSSAFWTICQGTLNPLDPIDGLLLANQDNLYPWQEKKYVSVEEALHRRNIAKWIETSPLEKDRLERLRKIHARDRI